MRVSLRRTRRLPIPPGALLRNTRGFETIALAPFGLKLVAPKPPTPEQAPWLDELERGGKSVALVTLCIGAGFAPAGK